jgi:hypothetical protein
MITDGQRVNAEITNAAFLSRTANSSTVGVIQLLNDGSPPVTNLQAAINSGGVRELATQVIDSGQKITNTGSGNDLIPVQSSGGEISGHPVLFANSVTAAQEITLIGLSDTDYLLIENSEASTKGLVMNGSIQLKRYVSITFKYVSVLEKWVEKCRNS